MGCRNQRGTEGEGMILRIEVPDQIREIGGDLREDKVLNLRQHFELAEWLKTLPSADEWTHAADTELTTYVRGRYRIHPCFDAEGSRWNPYHKNRRLASAVS